MEQGNSYKRPSGPSHDPKRPHLYIILTNKSPENDYLVVCVCSVPKTKNRKYDTTCLLNVGDHPFIRHDSYIDYHEAMVEKDATIQKGLANPDSNYKFILCEDLEETLLKRIQKGVLSSPAISPKFRGYFKKNCNNRNDTKGD